MNKNFNIFIYLKLLELKVLIIYLVIGCVSRYKDRYYLSFFEAINP